MTKKKKKKKKKHQQINTMSEPRLSLLNILSMVTYVTPERLNLNIFLSLYRPLPTLLSFKFIFSFRLIFFRIKKNMAIQPHLLCYVIRCFAQIISSFAI